MASATSSPHDLTQKLGSFLDRHLLIPLLDHIKSKGLYPTAEIEEAKLQLMFGTNMVDAAIDIYQELHSTKEVPQEYKKRREEVKLADWFVFAA